MVPVVFVVLLAVVFVVLLAVVLFVVLLSASPHADSAATAVRQIKYL